jgi:Tfp pilus assembly protein PilV
MACVAARWRRGLARGRVDASASIRGEAGIAFLEVLVTSVVLGIAVLGVSLMLSEGNTWVAAGADDRAALSLARQKIEQLRSVTFACIPLGGPGTKTAMTGCTATQNYNEGGATWVTATGGSAAAPSGRSFARVTCVEYVTEIDFGSPAYAGGNAASPCTAGAQTNVKRVTVIVRARGQAAEDEPVMLKAWITSTPGGL